jgi:hypothetical protein
LQLPDDNADLWEEILSFCYTSQWSFDADIVLDLKDYADRYGMEDLSDDCATMIRRILKEKPEEIMTIAAQATLNGVSLRHESQRSC